MRFKGGAFNPANWFKYVPRFMVAADAFSYGGLKEMRAYEMARNEARLQNKLVETPPMSNSAKANEILNKTSEREAIAEAQATQEGLLKNGKTKEERNAFQRRVWEIMEQGRGQKIIEDSAHFAAHGTFNYPPEGLIGFATEMIGELTTGAGKRITVGGRQWTIRPLKFIIPFTRIIANVANTALDYFPPTGLIRGLSGGVGSKMLDESRFGKGTYRKYTDEQRKTVYAKMSVGIAATIGLFILTEPPDDDEESYFEITAAGYGAKEFKKNYELQESKWQKYSIRLGKEWYSYQYTPLVLALAPLGFFRDEQKYHKERFNEKEMMANLSMAYFKSFSVLGDMTWVTQLTGMLDALKANTLAETESYFVRLAQSTVKGVVYPKFAEQTVQMIDWMSDNPRRSASTLIGKIAKDIPVVRGKYNTLLNAVGEPVMYDPFQMVSEIRVDPFWDFINDHAINIGTPDQKQKFWDDITKTERSMTDEEHYLFVLKSGPEIKRRIMNEVIGKDMSEEEIKKEITNIKSEVRKQLKIETWGWGDFRKGNSDKWDVLKANDAIQIPVTTPIDWMTDDGKAVATEEEMTKYNNRAMEVYAEYVLEYLGQDAPIDKKPSSTGEIVYYKAIDNMWTNAKAVAKGKIIEDRESPAKPK